MKPYETLSITLAILVGLLIPMVVILIRTAVKWTRVETKLDQVVKDLALIVEDKDKVHREMQTQMREDRNANNQRLRWLEEHLWNQHKEK